MDFFLRINNLFPVFGICFSIIACSPIAEPPMEKTGEKIDYASLNLPSKPNILWLVAEDLGPYLPSFGDSTVETPNLSRLAAEGVRYTHFFSPSGVCAPSRAAISTGMYPSGIAANHMRTAGNPKFFPKEIVPYEAMPPAGIKMHAERMREAGYYCTNNAKEDYQYKKNLMAWNESSKNAHWRNRPDGQPFFAIFNFEVTHESRIWAKANDSLWVDADLKVEVPPYLPDNEIGRQDVRRMYSNIKEMDAQVGKVLDQLEEDGLLESTIIFWYSDHGGPLPRQKRLCYDSGLHVPLIIRFPGQQRAGQIDAQLLSFIDLKPTIMSLAGVEPSAELDGKAFLGPFAVKEEKRYIHGAGDRFDGQYDMIRAVRDKRFKYLKNFKPEQPYYLPVKYREQMPVMQELLRLKEEGGLDAFQAQWFRETKDPEELFDLENDPHELHNLVTDPRYADKLVELRMECDRWMDEIGDKGEMNEADLIRLIWGGDEQPELSAAQFELSENTLSLNCSTPGASIGYQWVKAGEELSKQWELYLHPIQKEEGASLWVVTDRIGYVPTKPMKLYE